MVHNGGVVGSLVKDVAASRADIPARVAYLTASLVGAGRNHDAPVVDPAGHRVRDLLVAAAAATLNLNPGAVASTPQRNPIHARDDSTLVGATPVVVRMPIRSVNSRWGRRRRRRRRRLREHGLTAHRAGGLGRLTDDTDGVAGADGPETAQAVVVPADGPDPARAATFGSHGHIADRAVVRLSRCSRLRRRHGVGAGLGELLRRHVVKFVKWVVGVAHFRLRWYSPFCYTGFLIPG